MYDICRYAQFVETFDQLTEKAARDAQAQKEAYAREMKRRQEVEAASNAAAYEIQRQRQARVARFCMRSPCVAYLVVQRAFTGLCRPQTTAPAGTGRRGGCSARAPRRRLDPVRHMSHAAAYARHCICKALHIRRCKCGVDGGVVLVWAGTATCGARWCSGAWRASAQVLALRWSWTRP